ncbi:MAG: glycosyltransferase family 4 protein [Bacteroidia bacterium]
MRILQVCNKPPYPPKDGGSIAMNMLTHGLIACGNEVSVLAINTPKHFIKEEDIASDYLKKTSYQSIFVDTSIKPLHAILNFFTSESYNISRFYNKEFEKKLVDIITNNQFDIIQLESLWISCYVKSIRANSTAKIILRSHNVEYLLWERLAKNCKSLIKKTYLNFLSKRLKQYEIAMLNKYDGIACITLEDISIFKKDGCSLPMIHIPFGIDIESYQVIKDQIEKDSLFHIGAMDWMPNTTGIKWFLETIWSKILPTHPSIKLYLAGRSMPSWLTNLNVKSVVVEGEVVNSHQFMNSKSIMIVPLKSGGGMRVKIIEGMALGKTIISTTIGAEGIEYEDKKNILIADSVNDFEKAITKCLSDKNYCEEIGLNARALVENKYDNKRICDNLHSFYLSLK